MGGKRYWDDKSPIDFENFNLQPKPVERYISFKIKILNTLVLSGIFHYIFDFYLSSCFAMKVTNQKWDYASCNDMKKGFICKRPKLYKNSREDSNKPKTGSIVGVMFGVIIAIVAGMAVATVLVKRRSIRVPTPSISNPLNKIRQNGTAHPTKLENHYEVPVRSITADDEEDY